MSTLAVCVYWQLKMPKMCVIAYEIFGFLHLMDDIYNKMIALIVPNISFSNALRARVCVAHNIARCASIYTAHAKPIKTLQSVSNDLQAIV